MVSATSDSRGLCSNVALPLASNRMVSDDNVVRRFCSMRGRAGCITGVQVESAVVCISTLSRYGGSIVGVLSRLKC